MKQKLFSLWLLLSVAVGLSAYDFKVDELCYNITDTNSYTVEVTYERYPNWMNSAYQYLFRANIPESVTYNDNVYRVTSIGERAFYGCTGLTSITIPNSVTSIGRSAFNGCTGLTSITIPNSVTSIGDNAFAGCTSLTSITIPNSVTSIGGYAFSGCIGLTSVVIGNSVTSIGGNAFSGCTGLTSITIPNSVTSIGYSAFSGCTGLTSITIPNGVTSIGGRAFESCTGLTSITIPNSVTSIGDNAFAGCTGLTSIAWNAKNCSYGFSYSPFYDSRQQITSLVFGDSVQHIPGYLCAGMKNLASITIGNSVTSIGSNAFSGCTGLKIVDYKGDIKGWLCIDMISNPISYSHNLYINNVLLTELIIPEGITHISSIFAGCTGLTSVTIGNNVASIGNSAFSDCTGLTSVVIGNSVTSIGSYAFSGCKNVETIVFGSAVETIGESTFSGCQSIYEMTIYTTKVPTIQENTFTEVGTGATLRVPAGCAKKYKAHPYWGVFNIEEIPSEYTITVTCDPQQGQVSGSGTYTDGSEVTLTATANKGYAFSQWNDGNKDNPRKVTVTADATYTAEFALQNYVVTATYDPQQGQVTGGGTYPYGSEVTLTATPNTGYAFTQWNDGNKDNPRKVTVTADATYTAEFALQNYVVTATCDPQQGQVTGGGTYPYGSEVTLTATPNNGYKFKQWSDGTIANPYSFSVEKDVNIEALFEPTTPVENVAAEENNAPRKVFYNGQVYIQRGGKTYTIMGGYLSNLSKGEAQ